MERATGLRYCKICGRWLNEETWKKHQQMSLREHLKLKYFYGGGGLLNSVDMRPTERELLKKIMRLPSNKALRMGKFVNKIVYDELMYGIKNEGHLLLQIFGTQGSGKSTLALKIALMLKRAWKQFFNRDVNIYITFSFHETIQVYKQCQPGDIIIQDEAPALMGIDSRITVESLENLLALMRARQNSWIFCYPELIKQLVTPTLLLEVWGRIPDRKWTLAVAYSRMQWCLGWVFFDVSEVFQNKEFYEYYQRRKMENLEKVQASGGRVSALYEEDEYERILQKVLEVWEKKGKQPIMKKADVEKYMVLARIQLSNKMWRIYRDMLYDDLIAEYEKAMLAKKEEEAKREDIIKIGTFEGNFREYILQKLDEIDFARYKFTSKLVQLAKMVFQSLFSEADVSEPVMTQMALVEFLEKKYGLQTTNYTLSHLIKRLTESGIVGTLFEQWFHEINNVPFTGRKLKGEPDFVHPETNIAYSLKTNLGWRTTRRFVIREECAPEIKHTKDNNLPYFYLVFINPFWWSEPKSVRIPINDIPHAVTFHAIRGVQVDRERVRERRKLE